MNSITNLSAQTLNRVATLKGQIESLENQLITLFRPDGVATKSAPKRRGKMSAAGRARIAAAQKARWAKVKGRKSVAKPVKKARRKMSAAARARISALAKARWKKVKAAGKKRL